MHLDNPIINETLLFPALKKNLPGSSGGRRVAEE